MCTSFDLLCDDIYRAVPDSKQCIAFLLRFECCAVIGPMKPIAFACNVRKYIDYSLVDLFPIADFVLFCARCGCGSRFHSKSLIRSDP